MVHQDATKGGLNVKVFLEFKLLDTTKNIWYGAFKFRGQEHEPRS